MGEKPMRTSHYGLVLVLAWVVGAWGVARPARAEGAEGQGEKAKICVGTFDSRAVAVAHTRTESFGQAVQKLMDEYKKAEKAGDQQKMKELKAEGKAGQERVHQQGFGTASVANILAEIKDQLPEIAKKAGVDVIVSKWDITYQSPSAEFVDVTDEIIKPFKPNEKTLKIIEDLRKRPPVSLEELKNHTDQ
jgi:hypothetical protein